MPIDKGREGNDRPPDDWERIDSEFEKRDRIQRKWDAEHDPSPEWEAAARPLPPDYGLDRPRHREIPPEVAAAFGRTPEQIQALREKMFDELEARRDRPARFEPMVAAELREREGNAGEKTDGVLLDVTGRPVWDRPMRSGVDGPAAEVGRETLGLPLRKAAIMSHVEAHAAAEMHKRRMSEATLYLNKNPCEYPGGYGCDPNLPRMLPKDAKLTGYWRDDREGPAPPGEVGPVLDEAGRTWRGKVYRGTEGDDR